MDATEGAEEETTRQQEDRQNHGPRHVFILSGQSNMSGRGGVHHHKWDGVVPPECRPSPAILRFSARSRWVEARVPLHADIDVAKTCGVGPGMSFANAVLSHLLSNSAAAGDCGGAAAVEEEDQSVVGLVPCAVGGTAIREWERGSKLYEQMVRRAKEPVAAAKGGGGGGGGRVEIRAVMWYQGESDTFSRHVSDAYRAHMENLIHDLRSDLGLPSLPFIQVAIASGEGPYMEKVREAQLGMEDLPNVVCVDARGLPLKDDHLHLSTEAQARLGRMLAEAYIKNFAAAAAAHTHP